MFEEGWIHAQVSSETGGLWNLTLERAVVSCMMWLLGTEPQFSAGAVHSPKH